MLAQDLEHGKAVEAIGIPQEGGYWPLICPGDTDAIEIRHVFYGAMLDQPGRELPRGCIDRSAYVIEGGSAPVIDRVDIGSPFEERLRGGYHIGLIAEKEFNCLLVCSICGPKMRGSALRVTYCKINMMIEQGREDTLA